ncbi:MAG: CBS domain-containing protein [Candidatus Binatia bacterium]
MKIHDITKIEDLGVKTIGPERSVKEAIAMLVRFNIGSLPVCAENGRLVGIITERDVLRLWAQNDCSSIETRRVSEVMTSDLVIGVLDDDVSYVMRVMTDHRIRHLPIMDGDRLVQIISIGDVVKAQLDASSAEIRYLRDYVCG